MLGSGRTGARFLIEYIHTSRGQAEALAAIDKGIRVGKQYRMSTETLARAADEAGQQISMAYRDIGQPIEKVGKQVSRVHKDMNNAIEETGQTIDENLGDDNSPVKKADINLGRLIRHAALTIPVWYGLRNAMNAVMGTFREGVQYIRDFDAGMAKIKATLIGTANLAQLMDRIGEEVKKLALETGTSLVDVADTFYSFTEAGISAEEALQALEPTLKANVAMMGQASQTARTAAGIYNIMGETITEVSGTTEKFKVIFGIMFKLWQTNAFQAGEFTEALNNFAGAAKNFGINVQEMMTLLAVAHTLLQRGSSAGTLLTRAFIDLSKHIDKVSAYLGDTIDLRVDDHFDVLIRIIKKLREEFEKTGKVGEVVYQLFDIRPARITGTMVAGFEILQEELERIVGASAEEIVSFWKTVLEGFDVQMEQVNKQLDRVRIARGELGRAFIAGVLGTDDYDKALEKIADSLSELADEAERAGDVVRHLTYLLGALLAIKGVGALVVAETTARATAAATAAKVATAAAGGATVGILATRAIIAKAVARKAALLATKVATAVAKMPIAIPLVITATARIAMEKIWQKREKSFKERVKDIEMVNEVLKKTIQYYADLDKQAQEGRGDIELERILVTEQQNIALDRQILYTERLQTLGYNQLEIEMARLKIIKESTDPKAIELLEPQYQKVISELQNAIIGLSTTLQRAFEEGFAGILKGESTIVDMVKRIGEVWRNTWIEQVAGGLTASLFKMTGIGEIFGTSMLNVRQMFGGLGGQIEAAHTTVYDFILRAHQDGSLYFEAAIRGQPAPTIAGIPGIGTGGWTLPGFGAGGFWTQPFGTRAGPMREQTSPTGERVSTPIGRAPLTRGQALGVGIQSAMIGYSMYQSAGGGRMGMASGLLSGAGNLSLLAFGSNPIGWALTGLGMLLGAFGRRTQRQVEVRTEDRQISSRIDVTNKQLEIVNRNLVALRATFETYILPESAYFAEKRIALEDEFAISSNRGFGG